MQIQIITIIRMNTTTSANNWNEFRRDDDEPPVLSVVDRLLPSKPYRGGLLPSLAGAREDAL